MDGEPGGVAGHGLLEGLGLGSASLASDQGDRADEVFLDIEEEDIVSLAPGKGAWVPVTRKGGAHASRGRLEVVRRIEGASLGVVPGMWPTGATDHTVFVVNAGMVKTTITKS